MAFVPIDANKIKVGDPITKDIIDLIKSNLDDLDLRVNSLATTGGTVYILNGDFSFINFSISSPVIFIYKARQTFSINDFRVQLLGRGGLTSGTLQFDLQKSQTETDLSDAQFQTVLTSPITFDLSIANEYRELIAALNPSENDIETGIVLRIKITNYPINFKGSVLISIGGQ